MYKNYVKQINIVSRLGSHSQDSSLCINKYSKIQNPWHFWYSAFWVRDTCAVLNIFSKEGNKSCVSHRDKDFWFGVREEPQMENLGVFLEVWICRAWELNKRYKGPLIWAQSSMVFILTVHFPICGSQTPRNHTSIYVAKGFHPPSIPRSVAGSFFLTFWNAN
jgi:hypothetical protein